MKKTLFAFAGLMMIAASQAMAAGVQVKNAYCITDTSRIELAADNAGNYSAQLPAGVVATLHTHDTGFGFLSHILTLQQGNTRVSNSAKTGGHYGSDAYVRTEATLTGHTFFCEAAVHAE